MKAKTKFEWKCDRCGKEIKVSNERTLLYNRTLHETKHQVDGY